MHSHLVVTFFCFLKVLLWCLSYSQNDVPIYFAHTFICSWCHTLHPRIPTCPVCHFLFLFWVPCYCWKQRKTGILLKIPRNSGNQFWNRLSDCSVWSVHFDLLMQTQIACIATNFTKKIIKKNLFSKVLSFWYKSINRIVFVAWSCFCHTKKTIFSLRYVVFFLSLFYCWIIVSFERCIAHGLISKKCCMRGLI